MRAAAVQLNCTPDMDRNLEAAERLVRAAASDGAELVVLPERMDVRGGPKDYATVAERPRRTADRLGARARARARHRPRRRLGRRAPRRATSASRTPPPTSAPTARSRPSTARSTCSTSRSAASRYRESEHSEPGDEIVLSRDRRRHRPGPDGLLRPALSRALPHPRPARRPHRDDPGQLHQGHRRGALGRARARAGDREPAVRDRARPERHRSRPTATASATR